MFPYQERWRDWPYEARQPAVIELQWCQFLQKLHLKVLLADKEGIKKLRSSSVYAEEDLLYFINEYVSTYYIS